TIHRADYAAHSHPAIDLNRDGDYVRDVRFERAMCGYAAAPSGRQPFSPAGALGRHSQYVSPPTRVHVAFRWVDGVRDSPVIVQQLHSIVERVLTRGRRQLIYEAFDGKRRERIRHRTPPCARYRGWQGNEFDAEVGNVVGNRSCSTHFRFGELSRIL